MSDYTDRGIFSDASEWSIPGGTSGGGTPAAEFKPNLALMMGATDSQGISPVTANSSSPNHVNKTGLHAAPKKGNHKLQLFKGAKLGPDKGTPTSVKSDSCYEEKKRNSRRIEDDPRLDISPNPKKQRPFIRSIIEDKFEQVCVNLAHKEADLNQIKEKFNDAFQSYHRDQQLNENDKIHIKACVDNAIEKLITRLDEEKGDLQKNMTNANQSWDQMIERIVNLEGGLKTELNNITNNFNEKLEKDESIIETNIGNIQKQMLGNEDKLNSLAGQLSGNQQKLHSLAGELERASSDSAKRIEGIHGQINNINDRFDGIHELLKDLTKGNQESSESVKFGGKFDNLKGSRRTSGVSAESGDSRRLSGFSDNLNSKAKKWDDENTCGVCGFLYNECQCYCPECDNIYDDCVCEKKKNKLKNYKYCMTCKKPLEDCICQTLSEEEEEGELCEECGEEVEQCSCKKRGNQNSGKRDDEYSEETCCAGCYRPKQYCQCSRKGKKKGKDQEWCGACYRSKGYCVCYYGNQKGDKKGRKHDKCQKCWNPWNQCKCYEWEPCRKCRKGKHECVCKGKGAKKGDWCNRCNKRRCDCNCSGKDEGKRKGSYSSEYGIGKSNYDECNYWEIPVTREYMRKYKYDRECALNARHQDQENANSITIAAPERDDFTYTELSSGVKVRIPYISDEIVGIFQSLCEWNGVDTSYLKSVFKPRLRDLDNVDAINLDSHRTVSDMFDALLGAINRCYDIGHDQVIPPAQEKNLVHALIHTVLHGYKDKIYGGAELQEGKLHTHSFWNLIVRISELYPAKVRTRFINLSEWMNYKKASRSTPLLVELQQIAKAAQRAGVSLHSDSEDGKALIMMYLKQRLNNFPTSLVTSLASRLRVEHISYKELLEEVQVHYNSNTADQISDLVNGTNNASKVNIFGVNDDRLQDWYEGDWHDNWGDSDKTAEAEEIDYACYYVDEYDENVWCEEDADSLCVTCNAFAVNAATREAYQHDFQSPPVGSHSKTGFGKSGKKGSKKGKGKGKNGGTFRFAGSCHSCGKFGHRAKECRTKPYSWGSQRSGKQRINNLRHAVGGIASHADRFRNNARFIGKGDRIGNYAPEKTAFFVYAISEDGNVEGVYPFGDQNVVKDLDNILATASDDQLDQDE